MQMIQRIDNYFIGTDEGTIGDRFWFYGLYLATATITAATLFSL